MIMVDGEATLKRSIDLGDRPEGPEVVVFRAMTNTATRLYSDYSLLGSDGKTTSGKIDVAAPNGYVPTIKTPISKGGCFALWPNRVGNFAVFPLDDQTYTLASGLTNDTLPHSFVSGGNPYRNYLELGFHWPNKALPAGTAIDYKFLIALDNGNADPMTNLGLIPTAYGLSGSPACKVRVTNGKVLDRSYILSLQARNYNVRAVIGKAATPDDQLPVTVSGLSDNWDAGVYDTLARTIRRVGVLNRTAYALFDTTKVNDVIIGNLLTSDNPNVMLTLHSVDSKRAVALIHNPTPSPITCTVRVLAVYEDSESHFEPWANNRKDILSEWYRTRSLVNASHKRHPVDSSESR